MNYWELRNEVKRVIPRRSQFFEHLKSKSLVKEKGRKSNYQQFDLISGGFQKIERLLNAEEINSFAEVSLRAAACPMPFNIDVWDGLVCPFRCKYCFADYFRSSLYTSFFDNSKAIGLRHCNVDYHRRELDRLFQFRKTPVSGSDEVRNAIALEIPIRFGIRFEDFCPTEGRKGISLQLLQFLADNHYPLMINTKADLLGREDYVRALADNPAGAAVHITMISSDPVFNKKLEPGAPTFKQRVGAARSLSRAGVRVVARIEPFMVFLNDERDRVEEYMGEIRSAGISHITFDSYSYSANSSGIARNFLAEGYDFERMFLLTSDSQWFGSYLLGKFIREFQEMGFKCSTFDFGNVPNNDDNICCCVGDLFSEYGFNWGSGVTAIRYIKSQGGDPVRWSEFESFVIKKGGFLSESLKLELKKMWNLAGNVAWFLDWSPGLYPVGQDEDGLVWAFREEEDYREKLIQEVL